MPISITGKKLDEVKAAAPQLPVAVVTAEAATLDERDGVRVVIFYPLPEDNEVEVTERKGKKTDKVDNSDKIVSVLRVLGRARKTDLTYIQDGVEYALIDGDGEQIKHTSTLFTRKKGEGVEDDEPDAED